MNETKVCTKCKQEKQVTEFNKSSQVSDGLRSWCRQCDGEYASKWRKFHCPPKMSPEDRSAFRSACAKETWRRRKESGEFVPKPPKVKLTHEERSAIMKNAWDKKRADGTAIRKPNKDQKIVCSILKHHHKVMEQDNEHLTTDFIQNLLGVECDVEK